MVEKRDIYLSNLPQSLWDAIDKARKMEYDHIEMDRATFVKQVLFKYFERKERGKSGEHVFS